MKKLKRCPICGYNGEDVVFTFYCTNSECQNFRKDIKPIISDDRDDDNEIVNYYWPSYDDDWRGDKMCKEDC